MEKFDILRKLLSIPAILIAFTFHEYAHAFVADRLGDKTPKFQGRLTLNPIMHIDIIGFVMILLVGFGWAKPVQTNPSAYKNYYKDDLKVSFAGPFANFILGFIFCIILVLFQKLNLNSNAGFVIDMMLLITASINCTLFFLNLIPIPGFDGFHILRDLFPKFFYNMSDSMYKYELIIFIVLIMPIFGNSSIFDYIVGVPSGMLFNVFYKIASII